MIRFAKVESIGNDFVLVEPIDGANYGELAVRLCERRFGIGSDGLLVLTNDPRGPYMRMFNPDGTEDFCGNGLRCAAVYAHEKHWVGDAFDLLHGGKTIPTQMEKGSVRTRIGKASFRPSDVPHTMLGDLYRGRVEIDRTGVDRASALTTGSTHTILEVEEHPGEAEFETVSRALEHHPAFPARTSVIWMRVEAANHLRIRIWERGVGETLGCGTGSSAAAVVHCRNRGEGGTIAVQNPGGTVHVTLDGWDSEIEVLGTARVVYEGVVPQLGDE